MSHANAVVQVMLHLTLLQLTLNAEAEAATAATLSQMGDRLCALLFALYSLCFERGVRCEV
jgi:hypothetical protein